MTSEEDERKKLQRLWDKLRGKNGSNRSDGTPRPRSEGDNDFPDKYKWKPKKDRD